MHENDRTYKQIFKKLFEFNVFYLTTRRSAAAATDHAEVQQRGATPLPRSGMATKSPRLRQRRSGRDKLPHIRGQGSGEATWRSYHTPEVRGHGAAAQRSYPTPEARGGGREEQPTSKEQWLHGRRGPRGATPCSRSGETAVRSFPSSKVRETQVRR